MSRFQEQGDYDDEAGINVGGQVKLPDRDFYRSRITTFSTVQHYITHHNLYTKSSSIRDARLQQPHFSAFSNLLTPYAKINRPESGICSHFLRRCYMKPNRVQFKCGVWADVGDATLLILGRADGDCLATFESETFKFLRHCLVPPHKGKEVVSIAWSNYIKFLATGDDNGNIVISDEMIKMATVMEGAHSGAVTGLSYSPFDSKFVSCSDDGKVKVWQTGTSNRNAESVLEGHTADVKCTEWHPYRALIASGSRDSTIKLWDPKSGTCVSTLCGHKKQVSSCVWNKNGNWLASGSKDGVIKIYDIRTMKETEVLRGHNSDVGCMGWHPQHENLLLSGGYNGSLIYWLIGQNQAPHTVIADAHRQSIDVMCWHPAGHMVVSSSHDGIIKFWSRPPPGSKLATDIVKPTISTGIDQPVYGYGPLQVGIPSIIPIPPVHPALLAGSGASTGTAGSLSITPMQLQSHYQQQPQQPQFFQPPPAPPSSFVQPPPAPQRFKNQPPPAAGSKQSYGVLSNMIGQKRKM